MRIVHLASGLGLSGTSRSLSLLAPALADLGEEQIVLNLGSAAPFAHDLLTANVDVRHLRFRNGFDPTGVKDLRRAVGEFRPDVVHVWGNRAAVLSNWLRLPLFGRKSVPLVISDVRPVAGVSGRLVLRAVRFARIVREAPLLVRGQPIPAFLPSAYGLPSDARIVVSVTNFEPRTDPTAALTAFDILKHAMPAVHLLFVGDGPGRERAERMNRAVAFDDDRVRFLGVRNDVPAILATAEAVLISHHTGGRTTAAETVTAGRPIVAYDRPDLAGIVRDGETGVLVPLGEATRLTSSLYQILTDATLAAKLSHPPGSLAVGTSPAAAAREWQAIYRTAVG